MTKSALYLQENEEIREKLKNTLKDEDVDIFMASSAKEAFDIMAENDIMAVLVDCHIQDMKLFDFIKASIRKHPGVMLNICVDVLDLKMVTTIANIKQVKKLYMESWDIGQLCDGLLSTLDQVCLLRDYERRREELREEEKQFERTLESLKDALLRQRFSYNRLGEILKPCLEAVIESSDRKNDPEWNVFCDFVRISCEKMLRVQTTIKVDADGFNDYLARELPTAIPKSGRIVIDNISSCVYGNPGRDKMASLAFCLWLLTLYQGYKLKRGNITVESYYLESGLVRFEICTSGTVNEKCPQRIDNYIRDIIMIMALDFQIENSEDTIKYIADFKLK